jgi:hypothetical protein
MSSKTQTNTTQAITYDAASKAVYDPLQKGINDNLQQDMQTDPTKSSTFNLGLQSALRGNMLAKARASQNIFGNMQGSGFSGAMQPFQQAQINKAARAGGAMDAQAVNSNFMNYDMLRRQATGLAMNYRPLQTGQTSNSTQTTSGTGTWLPQVIGAGAQIGLGFATGGLSLAGSAAGKAAGMGMAGTNAGASGGGFISPEMSSGSYFNNANPFTAGNNSNMGLGMFNPNPYSGANYFSGGR